MANKIPVGRTIGGAYGFAFGNIINNIGEIWIPMAILYAILFLFQKPYMEAMTGLMSRDPQAAMRIVPMFFGIMLLFVVLLASAYAGLTREALGLRKGSAFLQFPFGADTWRLIGANVLFFLVMCVVYIGVIILSFIGGFLVAAVFGSTQSGSGGAAAGALVVALIGIVVACAILYIAVRLSFLLAPVVVAERRISLTRSWQLTGGSFWRIFVIMLALLLPLVVAEAIYIVAVFGDVFANFHPGMSPEEIQQQQSALMQEMTQRQMRYWFIAYPVGFILTAIVYGMFAGAGAAAYRAVAPSDGALEAEAMS